MALTGTPERNMYLAEDRILCFEIVTKKREGWMYVLTNFFCCVLSDSEYQPQIREERKSFHRCA